MTIEFTEDAALKAQKQLLFSVLIANELEGDFEKAYQVSWAKSKKVVGASAKSSMTLRKTVRPMIGGRFTVLARAAV